MKYLRPWLHSDREVCAIIKSRPHILGGKRYFNFIQETPLPATSRKEVENITQETKLQSTCTLNSWLEMPLRNWSLCQDGSFSSISKSPGSSLECLSNVLFLNISSISISLPNISATIYKSVVLKYRFTCYLRLKGIHEMEAVENV